MKLQSAGANGNVDVIGTPREYVASVQLGLTDEAATAARGPLPNNNTIMTDHCTCHPLPTEADEELAVPLPLVGRQREDASQVVLLRAAGTRAEMGTRQR